MKKKTKKKVKRITNHVQLRVRTGLKSGNMAEECRSWCFTQGCKNGAVTCECEYC